MIGVLLLLNFVVQINSTPSGAEIWVDGINTEEIYSDSVSFSSTGTHNFELHLAGYEVYQENISVSGSNDQRNNIKTIIISKKAILYDSKIYNIEQLQIQWSVNSACFSR